MRANDYAAADGDRVARAAICDALRVLAAGDRNAACDDRLSDAGSRIAAGHPDAEIAWVGPVGFYAKAAGASVSRTFRTLRRPLA